MVQTKKRIPPKVVLLVTDKQFGKNFINYEIRNLETGEVIKDKCGNHAYISKIYHELIDQHGIEFVRMLAR